MGSGYIYELQWKQISNNNKIELIKTKFINEREQTRHLYKYIRENVCFHKFIIQ